MMIVLLDPTFFLSTLHNSYVVTDPLRKKTQVLKTSRKISLHFFALVKSSDIICIYYVGSVIGLG